MPATHRLKRAFLSLYLSRLKPKYLPHFIDPNLIAITGNTTMVHFLCGFPAEHIGKAPFIPVNLEPIECHVSELQIESQAPVFIMPGISAYVGADIVASLIRPSAFIAGL